MPTNNKKDKNTTTKDNTNQNTKPVGEVKNLNTTTKGLFEDNSDKKEKH